MSVPKEKHWGEFEDSNDDPWGDHSFVPSDYQELMVPQVYPPTSISLYQPSQQLTSSFQILSGESCRSDPIVQNTIRCLQHTRHVSHLINRAQSLPNNSSSNNSSNNSSSNNGGSEGSSSSLPACPPMPAETQPPRPPLSFQNLNFLPPQSTAFTSGQESGLNLEVEHSTARKMLRQSVALVLAHSGFTDTTETTLRTLTDLLHEFMAKFTKTLRNNTDDAILLLNYCPFHDVLEQTMQQMNVGGFKDLHKMYKDRVLNYDETVRNNSQHLTNVYTNLVNKQQQNSWQSNNSSNAGVGTSRPFAQMLTAGGGSINITIGALPGSTGVNYPNLTASNSLDDGSIEASSSSSTNTRVNAGRNSSSAGAVGRSNSLPTANITARNVGTVVRNGSNAAASSIIRTNSSSSSGGARVTATAGSSRIVPSAATINNSIINLEQELSRQYTPVNLQSADGDGRNQNSPLATHFTINPR